MRYHRRFIGTTAEVIKGQTTRSVDYSPYSGAKRICFLVVGNNIIAEFDIRTATGTPSSIRL